MNLSPLKSQTLKNKDQRYSSSVMMTPEAQYKFQNSSNISKTITKPQQSSSQNPFQSPLRSSQTFTKSYQPVRLSNSTLNEQQIIDNMTREEKIQLLNYLNEGQNQTDLIKKYIQNQAQKQPIIRSSKTISPLKNNRPQTAVQGRISNDPFYQETFKKNVQKSSGKKPKKVKSVNLQDLVDKNHRLNLEQLVAYLKIVQDTAKNLQVQQKDIQGIFNKILNWKKQFGDLEQQERAVQIKLKNEGASFVTNIHNVKTIMIKMLELQDEIGLTNDEVTIIVYTSLDLDWFNSMLVLASEFTKWFNLNFEGEDRDELDFQDEKLLIWQSVVHYSSLLLNSILQLQSSNFKQSQILKQEWWIHQRYLDFSTKMLNIFEQKPVLKSDLRKIFADQKDKLSYYALFQFIEFGLQIQMQSFEKDALESRLDRLGLAFIEFNEFNEFCAEYGIDWGEQINETDLEDVLEEKLNLSYKDYKVTKKDYFNDCPTMLTSEKAALALATQIYTNTKFKQSQGQNTLRYTDPDFGPLRKSDEKGSYFAMYKSGEVPKKGLPDPKNVEWVFADQLCVQGEIPQFVDDGVASNDCIQGNLGDCWLISALSVLATKDELIRGGRSGLEYDSAMIIDKELASILSKGVYPPIFHKFRSIGLYVIRFYKNFNWIYVLIDERIPVDKDTKKPVFGHCRNIHELWVALIEKAYAKMHGCYENLISGYVDEGIQELTGFQPEKILLKDEKTGVFPHKSISNNFGGSDGFWNFLQQRRQDDCLMGCSINGNGKGGELIIDGKPCGLIKNHAYGINDVIQFDDPFNQSLKVRLLRLRNPWGKSEWKGAWGAKSEEEKKYRKSLLEYIETLTPDEKFDLDADDGTFLIDYDNWKNNFTQLFVNIDFPEKWTGLRFYSQWTKSNAGGIPNKNEQKLLERYGQNPQFLIHSTNDTEVVFSLQQLGGRLPINGQYSEYPFSDSLKYACVAVFKLKKDQQYLSEFSKEDLVYLSPLKRERENTGRVNLQKNESYVIVCSTEKAGVKAKFNLSVYFNQQLRDVNIMRIFHPNDKNNGKEEVLPFYIPEEAEKLVQQTPSWKLQLVKESLSYMISDEDAGTAQ